MPDVIREITELLKAVAWPFVTVLALMILRGEIRSFVAKLAETLGNAAQISIGAKGLDIKYEKKIAVINSRLSSLGAVQSQVTETVYKTDRRQRESGRPEAPLREIPKELRELATEYVNVDDADRQTRILRKNEIAVRMGDLVIRNDVSRELLAKEQDEALYVALAAAASVDPQPEDVKRLLDLASAAKRLHVRYKIVVSLGSLANKGLVRQELVSRVREALDRMSTGADASLLQIINETKSLLDVLGAGELVLAT
jgi:hypothetical protein